MISARKYTFLISIIAIASIFTCHLSVADNARQPVSGELRVLLKAAVTSSDSFKDRFHAEVWLLTMSHKLKGFVENPEKRLELLRGIHREAIRAQLEPELVLAVIQIESAFDPFAVSRAGAQGLMQVMPFWKEEIGRPEDNLIQFETNLRYGCTILKHYLEKEKGRVANALARYNGSYGSYRYSRKVMDAWFEHWR